MRQPESPQVYTIRDDGPLCDPDEDKVLNGRLEPGLVLHACPMTVEGRIFLYSESKQDVAVINQEGSGSSAGVRAGPEQENQAAESFDTPDEEFDNDAAYAFGEKLCQKSAKDWTIAQSNDETAKTAMTYIENDATSGDVTEEELSPGIDVMQLKRLVARGKLMEIPSSQKKLVRRPSRAPDGRPNRNPRQYERLLGDEPVRTYVPLLLRPWVMDCAHKEAVRLGDKVKRGL